MKNEWLLVLALTTTIAAPLAAQRYSDRFEFLKAVRERDAETVVAMITNPGSIVIDSRESGTGEGALHTLVRDRDLLWVRFMLGRGARPDIQREDGTTPLIVATQLGWIDGAAELLSRGANANLGNRNGETPLIIAVQRRDIRIVRLLLAQRADPNQRNGQGLSALDYGRQDSRAASIVRMIEQHSR